MITIVCGAQYGSEGKGAIAAHLAKQGWADIAIRVGGSNAGHTVVDREGRRWPFRHLPVATVISPTSKLVLAEGSEIDLPVLFDEIRQVETAGYRVWDRLLIDEQATIVTDTARKTEKDLGLHEQIGSTAKGVGAARSERLMRTAPLAKDESVLAGNVVPQLWRYLNQEATVGVNILIEGTQGYGLGLHAGHYPKCTSGNCRGADHYVQTGLAMGVAPTQVVLVARTYPIRVAGDSGPLENETNWGELGVAPELTTVTQKPRRVGEWAPDLVRTAVQANGPYTSLAVNFIDYLFPQDRGVTDPALLSQDTWQWVSHAMHEVQCEIRWVGTGPDTVVDLRGYDPTAVGRQVELSA